MILFFPVAEQAARCHQRCCSAVRHRLKRNCATSGYTTMSGDASSQVLHATYACHALGVLSRAHAGERAAAPVRPARAPMRGTPILA